ncbi:MAG: hypothetical protein SFW67_10620 [Myxococcaceae bacterium]|nr:hypothetical protein [Myxococcaceae bacterium]
MKARGGLLNGLPHGRWQMWCGTQQSREVFFVEGLAEGCEWVWLCTGQRDSMGRWARGAMVGEWLHYLGDVPSNVVREGAPARPGGGAQGGAEPSPSRR